MVHLVRARLDTPPLPRARLRELLSLAERERVARFRFERHRRRAEVAAGLMRVVLADVVGRHADELVFETGEFGKPALAEGPEFNMSHSGEWWLFGWAELGRVGVDVEIHRELDRMVQLTRSTFHPDEAARVLAETGAERTAAFFRVWTRKEAFIKALGLGLSYPLDRFVVASEPDPPRGLLRLDDPATDPADWSLRPVEWAEGLEAAVAWDRPGARTTWHDLPGEGA